MNISPGASGRSLSCTNYCKHEKGGCRKFAKPVSAIVYEVLMKEHTDDLCPSLPKMIKQLTIFGSD